MLSGRYPSDDFADLRPRLTWDRLAGPAHAARRREARRGHQRRHDSRSRALRRVPGRRARPGRAGRRARRGDGLREPGRRDLPARRLDVADRGDHPRPRAGVAGAGRARQDAVLAGGRRRPAARARPPDRRAGARRCASCRPAAAIQRLVTHHDLDQQAAENLLRYLADQAAAAGAVPDDRTILIERCRDELGDWRICVLSPFGGRIHAPWAMAAVERARAETGLDVETMWTDDGFVVRFPETEEPPDPALMIPASDEVEALVAAAARRHRALRREVPRGRGPRAAAAQAPPGRPQPAVAAAQARRRPARASPRSSDRSRCCSRPTASACATSSTCRRWSRRSGDRARARSAAVTVDSAMPSPFASALLFGYVANYHLRRRCAARRAARPGAVDRPGAAARAARRRRAARAPRRRRARRGRAAAAAPRSGAPRADRWTGCTICCCASAISAPTNSPPAAGFRPPTRSTS